MPKIKKFNLKLSIYQIQQNLRRAKFPFTDDTIDEIGKLCDELKNKISPAVYFETFRDISKIGVSSFVEFPSEAAAATIVVSTLGAGAEEFAAEYMLKKSAGITLSPSSEKKEEIGGEGLSTARDSDSATQEEYADNGAVVLAGAVISQAAEEVKKFPWKIVSEESEEEKCTLSPRYPVTRINELENIKNMLSKIEVFPTENGLKPLYSFVEYAFWLPPAKKKKT